MIWPSLTAKNLAVILDNEMTCTPSITAVANPADLSSFLIKDAMQLLVPALVISRQGYCNSSFAGLSASSTKPFQRIQNAAVRFVFNLCKFSHVTPSSMIFTDFM